MMSTKVSVVLFALVASVALVQAAGGIKGIKGSADTQRLQAVKGPRQQQQQEYLAPPPPPPRPVAQAPIKGPGQVAPVFTAARVQPVVVQQQEVQQQEQEPEPTQQQQQQEEVEPNPAAQDPAPAVAAPARAAPVSEEEANPRPEPYAFNYAFDAGDSATSGSSQREEQQDASGKVTGFYTLRGEDGRDRRVDYIADANGFRATISTNEMGTAPKDSADVDWNAQNPTDAQLRAAESATQLARQRALANPIQQQPIASSSSSLSKISSPRQNAVKPQQPQQQEYSAQGAQQVQQVLAPAAAKGRPQFVQQLQEPFEQIRQTELNARAARKSRHAPFYLFTV